MAVDKKDVMDTNWYFQTPVYSIMKPEWLNPAIKATDKHIKESQENKKPELKERKKFLGNKDYLKVKDHGMSYHSGNLNGVSGLEDMEAYIGQTSWNLLDEWGYDMSKYTMFWTEFWVQEFSKNGGGHHATHVHWDNHISGFYFLKCSERTSKPVFHDPRPAALMSKLPFVNESMHTIASDKITLNVKPGSLVIFNGYLPHQFTVDNGLDPFRFIHFNLQALPNNLRLEEKIHE